MANTKISHLGSRLIAIDGLAEIRRPALGDGTSKPGDLVYIVDATMYATCADLGAVEYFNGILDDLPTIAEDTAITAGVPCSVIIPQSGHHYRVHMEDPGGAEETGTPVGLSDHAGAMEDYAAMNTAGVQGYLSKAMANGDTVGEVQWR